MSKDLKVTFFVRVPDEEADFIEADLRERGDEIIEKEFPEIEVCDVFQAEEIHYITTTVPFGKITLSSKVQVTDPSYNLDVWCTKTIENMLPGEYGTFATIADRGMLGRRVSELMIVHNSVELSNLQFIKTVTGDIGVDSGNCGFFDYEKYKEAKEADDKFEAEHNDIGPFTNKWWSISDKARALGGTLDDWGVLSHSGYGDGGYDLYLAYDESGENVIAAKVVYMYDEEE
jgi:hypothetical protein